MTKQFKFSLVFVSLEESRFCLDNLQRYEEAIDSFDKALKIKLDDPEVWEWSWRCAK